MSFFLFRTGHEPNLEMTRGLNVHHTKACRLQEYTSNNAPYFIEARPRSSHAAHAALTAS